MKKFLVLALSSAFLFAACNDDDKNSTDSVDMEKYCSIAMGKACGYNISDDVIAKCKSSFTSDVQAHDNCKEDLENYYNCMNDLQLKSCDGNKPCACIPDNACASEHKKANTCLSDKYPDINYNDYCNIVTGKVCGRSMDEGLLSKCVNVYSNQAKNHELCKSQGDAYFSCIENLGNGICNPSDDVYCKSESDAYATCLDNSYPAVKNARSAKRDIDFDKFCVNVMGKSCGFDISDDDLEWCANLYADEYVSHAKCATKLSDYYKCVANVEVTPCQDPSSPECTCGDENEACQAQIDAAVSCLYTNYPAEMIVDDIDFDAFCNVVMGKACGYDISDEAMDTCVTAYREDTLTYAKCADYAESYYSCVSNLSINDCSGDDDACECIEDEDACDEEIELLSQCISREY